MKGKLVGRLIKPEKAIKRYVEISIAYYKELALLGEELIFYKGMKKGAADILLLCGLLKLYEIDVLDKSAEEEGIKLALKNE